MSCCDETQASRKVNRVVSRYPGHNTRPGTRLRRMFRLLQIEDCPPCQRMSKVMDAWGSRECRERIEEIVTAICFAAASRGFDSDVVRPWVRRAVVIATFDFHIWKSE